MSEREDRARPNTQAGEEAYWQAILARDAGYDGCFVYGVVTTGVFCRASCPARHPKRANVRFFDTADAALTAGFRPCRRCRPDTAGTHARRGALVAALCRHIEAAENEPSLDELARLAGMSRFHVQRLFKATTGLSPKAYAAANRAARLRQSLRDAPSIADAGYEAGFGSSGRLYAAVPAVLGMRPKDFRRGGDRIAIRFALGECSMGSILVGATDRGICAILLGDEPGALLVQFQNDFPAAELQGGDAEFEQLVARVVGMVEMPWLNLELPLDVRGTAFQHRVWQALRSIPPGQTASYAEIAQRIGAPSSVRAVAQACAANRLAVAIPCHRVIRMNGELSGYRWGIARKRCLLEREREQAAAAVTD